jgi:hypothetical protein
VRAFVEAATLSLLADVALARRSIDAPAVRCQAALASIVVGLALVSGAACSRPVAAPAPSASGASSAAAAAPWSREALAPHRGNAEPLVPGVIGSIDPSALDDLVAAAPKLVAHPTALDGGTMIGADSGVPVPSASADAPPAPEAPSPPHVVIGAPTEQAPMATPAIERAARAQLYWNLVQRCRDKAGNILPADAIKVHFIIDVDGYIPPASILATASAAQYAEAAQCMRRELSTATFRAPAATWGRMGEVNATLPSVD